MIQRIQTLFLLLTAVGFGALFVLPMASSDVSIPQFLADNVYNILDHPVLTALTGAGSLASLVAVFLFKNRDNQLRLSYVVTIIAILLPLIAFLLLYNEGTAMVSGAQIEDEAGLYIFIINLILSFFSSRYIKKDQKIVESMDRLR